MTLEKRVKELEEWVDAQTELNLTLGETLGVLNHTNEKQQATIELMIENIKSLQEQIKSLAGIAKAVTVSPNNKATDDSHL